MAIHLRKRKLRDGRLSLYLDIYHNKKRKIEFLELYLIGDRSVDRDILRIANKKKAELDLDVASQRYDFSPNKQNADFYQFARQFVLTKEAGNQAIYNHSLRHLRLYSGDSLSFNLINAKFCSAFKSYLLSIKTLKPNSKVLYFIKFKSIIRQAIREEILLKDPTSGISLIGEEVLPKYLELEELQKLTNTPCPDITIRNAFLFSCSTGLRYSDVERLRWEMIQNGRVVLSQKKTRIPVVIPLSRTALRILELQKEVSEGETVFQFSHARTVNRTLKRWAKSAGIQKDIHFHVARHSFATLALNAGIDIYMVSKLLGHKKLQTTQGYAKLLDKTKEDAILLLPQF